VSEAKIRSGFDFGHGYVRSLTSERFYRSRS
jgi:hypothetical protein